MTILLLLIGFVIGGLVLYLILRPKIIQRVQLDEKTEERNREIWQENEQLDNFNTILRQSQTELQSTVSDLTHQVQLLQVKEDTLTESMSKLASQAEEAGRNLEEVAIALATTNIEQATAKLGEDYQSWQEDINQQYLELLKEAAMDFDLQFKEKTERLSSLQQRFAELESATAAAIEANRRAAASAEEKNFYRLQLSEEDIQEIKKLREVLPYLRDKEPLNKVIYKAYYEKPYTDLVGRVVGQGSKSGIYKITDLTNGKCYVGQSVNIAERWRQHIKRGVGAEPPTRNKLYPAMLSVGVENFTFELIEECPSGQLDAREDFWQEYFHAKDFGYSMK